MSDRMKELLTPLAVFIAGFAPAYYASPDTASWPRWVMAGLIMKRAKAEAALTLVRPALPVEFKLISVPPSADEKEADK